MPRNSSPQNSSDESPSCKHGYQRELLLLYPSLSIYGPIPGNITQIQRLDNRRAVSVKFTCEPKISEFLKSVAKMQAQFNDTVFFELKILRRMSQPGQPAKLNIYTGRANLASQIDSERDNFGREVHISMDLDERLSSTCDFEFAGQQFFSLTARKIEAYYST
ncbi:hypothetical protein BOX15_Mlig030635g3 [Macrostomum lignano]|uniref:Uncharacterized protein n=3 Tax=Macrostomum lignano TaxID=282301 RepID=A0A267H3P5_9PLAT|nr:hypothetical protein BOX15_Mlig030635g1 [Macrostomum lignano]PAA92911.1 hypothetical protein BOX15_Mlig030635g3 [Macrostomum lignano]